MNNVLNKTDFDLRLRVSNRAEYNGLTDPNLIGFFASPYRRKILLRQHLVDAI